MPPITDRYDISVIIPTFNRSRLLVYTLTALCHQNIDKDRFEVIICDDGSKDNTRVIVKNFERRVNIKYIYQEDRGYRPASARNKGILAAEGRACVFIDSGVLLNENCLEEHINFYKLNPMRAAIIGYVYGFDRSVQSVKMIKRLVKPDDVSSTISILSQQELFSDVREEHYAVYANGIHDLPATWYYYWTCHVSAIRSELIEAGLFDEQFDGRWGVEDNEIAYRLSQLGVKIYLLRSAEAIHYPHEKDKEGRRAEGYQNCLYFNNKFKSLQTRVVLEHYMNDKEFVDLNKLCMEAAQSVDS
jgi:glycosyltransferase involved in cell wall biosynthesis